MADIKKLYKQLKRYDNEDRIDFDESSGKLRVIGDYIIAEAVDQGQVTDININYLEDDYTSMTDNMTIFEHNKTAFGIMAGILDGSLLPEMDDNDVRLLYMKRKPNIKVKRMVTGGSIASMLIGVFFFLLCAFMIVGIVMSWRKSHNGLCVFLAFLAFISAVAGIIFVRNSLRISEVTSAKYLFSRVDHRPEDATIKRILQAVCEKTRTDAIEIKLDLDRVPTLFSSKIGGVPYWDMSKEYPKDGSGQKMVMLAQINLSELPENSKLPKKGMLQFFIAADNSYGRYFDGSTDGHKVVYHSSIDESLTEKQVWDLGVATSLETDCFPVSGEFAVKFNVARVYMSPEDSRISEVIRDASNRMGIFSETYEALELFSEEQIEMLKEHSVSHEMFGHPSFVQWDPRGEAESKKYDELLFQLSSEWNNTSSELYPGRRIMWGDAGICQFFINNYALSKLDFSDVLYNWEC